MKISSTLVGVLVLSSSLAACSGSDSAGTAGSGSGSASYCKDLSAAKPVFAELAAGDLSQLEKVFATFHRLADEAPGAVEDDWRILDAAATSVEKSITGTGLTFADLGGIQDGTVPEGVDQTKLAGLVAELQKLNTTEFADARAAIVAQAKDSCNVELGAAQP